MAMEEVVAQHQGRRRPSKKIGPNQKGLGQAIGAGLHRIGNRHPPGRSIAQQPLEGGLVHRGGDDQHLPNPRQHQGAEGVINHRLVVHRQQLFAHRLGDRMEPGTATPSQDDPFSLLAQACPFAGRMLPWQNPPCS